MMIYILVVAALLAHAQASIPKVENSSGNIDIYPYVIQSLRELKLRQLENKGVKGPQDIQHASSVCYDELGCFDKDGTFKHLKQLPEPPETVNTQFLLYTKKNPHMPQIMDYTKPETVKSSNINPKAPIKFLTHGFGGKNNLTWIWQMKTALLEKEDLNVVIIDWSLGARIPYYIAAAVNTELVGAQAAVLYYIIKDNFGIQEKDLHVIGFSLGAQVVGFIGKRMKEMRGTRPGRATGLDPASPLFEDYGEEVHLSKEDADFVDVIHTNADLLLYGGVGMGKAVGHVDYYPNGGKRQPGCGSTIGGAFIDIFKGDNNKVCNHERSVHLFTASIRGETNCQFTSYKCDDYEAFQKAKCLSCPRKSCGTMGYEAEGTGTNYLMTKAEPPYCTDITKLGVHFSKDIKKSYGAIVLTLTGPDGAKENITITEKDDKLTPGDEKVFVITLEEKLTPIKEVTALYMKYNGWLAKGTDTFSLQHVSFLNNRGKYLFKTCPEVNVVLNDNEFKTLKSC
ncbi:pancreatic lipase-related protein 2-like [Uloborus diversus]|uniref:pancreatic lipase-related protein 2-like n=1 Tax=Uloborus diversus TaxID=327109 RepID=UPI002409F56C|nr:pancreatic lipase-related protein 2-like [Uloborus diversus]